LTSIPKGDAPLSSTGKKKKEKRERQLPQTGVPFCSLTCGLDFRAKREDKSEPKQVEEKKEVKPRQPEPPKKTPLQQYKVTDGEFSSYPEIHAKTAEKLTRRGIVNLFPIQMYSFYPVYNREDVVARDLTGSGKTLAFALPLIEYLRYNKFLGSFKLQAIVLVPTRELAL